MTQAEDAFIGARGTDSVTLLTPTTAAALKSLGFDFSVQYLGTVGTNTVQAILNAGLAFMPVTYADRFDGPGAAEQCARLGLPAGVTVWLDLEGIGPGLAPAAVIAQINAWAKGIDDRGYMPGLYVGAGCKLTSAEIYALNVVRYWRGQSRLVDRNNDLVEPGCGWCCTQLYPHVGRGGVDVDVDVIGCDFRNRLPVWSVT
jgi:hypothetical protein